MPSTAALQTLGVCVLVELVALVVAWHVTGHVPGAVLWSIIWLGPLSAWLAPALYRYLRRANAP